jgi:hypothetical protein
MLSSTVSPASRPDHGVLSWLPVLAIVWMGAVLRALVAVVDGEVLNFGSTLAAGVVVLFPLLVGGSLWAVQGWGKREAYAVSPARANRRKPSTNSSAPAASRTSPWLIL